MLEGAPEETTAKPTGAMRESTCVKVCGVTTVEDARMCLAAGVDAIGLNFWPGTPRRVGLREAEAIVAAVGDALEVVGVFVDEVPETIARLQRRLGLRWVQLHGDESPDDVRRLLPHAYKAVGVASAADVDAALRFPGERLLLDARVPSAMPGGTGHRFDWELARGLASRRTLMLAGGIHPGNVAEAIARVRPAWIDVASGVERAPGVKDPRAVEALVAAARARR